MTSKKGIDCRNYFTGIPTKRPHHELVKTSKFFGLIKGDRCLLCNRFFVDESLKFWKKNDN